MKWKVSLVRFSHFAEFHRTVYSNMTRVALWGGICFHASVGWRVGRALARLEGQCVGVKLTYRGYAKQLQQTASVLMIFHLICLPGFFYTEQNSLKFMLLY